jgi:hypothetical protein
MEVSGQLHALAALSLDERAPRNPQGRRVGVSGLEVVENRNISAPTGSRTLGVKTVWATGGSYIRVANMIILWLRRMSIYRYRPALNWASDVVSSQSGIRDEV